MAGGGRTLAAASAAGENGKVMSQLIIIPSSPRTPFTMAIAAARLRLSGERCARHEPSSLLGAESCPRIRRPSTQPPCCLTSGLWPACSDALADTCIDSAMLVECRGPSSSGRWSDGRALRSRVGSTMVVHRFARLVSRGVEHEVPPQAPTGLPITSPHLDMSRP